jgi:hypothetical protein
LNGTTRYRNTDLDLTSPGDLTALAGAFQTSGVPPLHVTRGDDGFWYASFETYEPYTEPESNIAAILVIVDALPGPLRFLWNGCTRREFNIGYDCGDEPRAFQQGLSAELLGRMAAAGASLRVTLYSDRE